MNGSYKNQKTAVTADSLVRQADSRKDWLDNLVQSLQQARYFVKS